MGADAAQSSAIACLRCYIMTATGSKHFTSYLPSSARIVCCMQGHEPS